MPDFEGWYAGYLASVGVLCTREESFAIQFLEISPTGRLILKSTQRCACRVSMVVKTDVGGPQLSINGQ